MNIDAGGRVCAGDRGGVAYECINELRMSDFSLTWHLSGPPQQHLWAGGRNLSSESKVSFIIEGHETVMTRRHTTRVHLLMSS